MEPSIEDPPPTLLAVSRYGTKIKSLGRGTYGHVDLYGGPMGEVAIKISPLLRRDLLDKQTLNEYAAFTIVSKKHPNIVDALEIVIEPGYDRSMMVMPYADRGTLATYKVPKDELVSISYQMLCGISFLHHHGIVHRDLKPANILVYGTGKVAIADFGSAVSQQCVCHTPESYEVTSPLYRAPEIFMGGTYSPSADIWSAGLIIYEMYTGTSLLRVTSKTDSDGIVPLIEDVLGSPTPDGWPDYDLLPGSNSTKWAWRMLAPAIYPLKGVDDIRMEGVLTSILRWNPSRRPTAYELLSNTTFDVVRDISLEYPVRSCLQVLDSRAMLYPPHPAIRKRAVVSSKDWILAIVNREKIPLRTFIYACGLIDRTVSMQNPTSPFFNRRASMACLIIATHYLPCMAFGSEFGVHDGMFYMERTSVEELRGSIARVLETVKYQLADTTSADYIELYAPQYPARAVALAYEIAAFLAMVSGGIDPRKVGTLCIVLGCAFYGDVVRHRSFLTDVDYSIITSIPDESYGWVSNIEKLTLIGSDPKSFLSDLLKRPILV